MQLIVEILPLELPITSYGPVTTFATIEGITYCGYCLKLLRRDRYHNTNYTVFRGTLKLLKSVILYLFNIFYDIGSLSYRNQSNDLQSKSTGWFLCHRDLRNERVKTSVASFVVTLE